MPSNRSLWLIVKLVAALWLAAAGYAIFFIAPDENTMHEIQRIFYIHVASAWTAGVAYFVVAAAGAGVAFTTIVLITGPIWAHPVWGIWWTWDPRLTSTFVLWLMYIAYLLIRNLVDDPQRRAVVSAAYGIFAFADVPIVFMAIRWWRGQHPSPVIAGGEGSSLDPTMKAVLFFTWAATLILFCIMTHSRYQLEAIRHETEVLRQDAEDLTAESVVAVQIES